jgi:cell division protein FtsW (lipid II flippase)
MDWGLIGMVLALSVIGSIVVYSATIHNADIAQLWRKQIFWFAFSLFVMWLFSRIDYRFWMEVSYIFYTISIISLILVLFIGDETNGAKRWIRLGLFS